MRRWMIVGLMSAGLIGFSGAASAQQAPAAADQGAVYCVYDDLTSDTDYEKVAEAFLFKSLSQADQLAAKKLVDAAAAVCKTKFKMTPAQANAMGSVGIYGATTDYLTEDLMFNGLERETINLVPTAWMDLTDEDLARVLKDDWRKDAAIVAKLKAALIAKGVPDLAFVMDPACDLVRVSLLAQTSALAFAAG